MFHIYTKEEINCTTKFAIDQNWGITNFLTFANAYDGTDGSSNIVILAFENKLNALYYFRDFLMGIKESCPGKNFFLKLSEIDNLINLIKLKNSDEDIIFDIVDFEFGDISLTTNNSGYWEDASKPLLEQIIDEIDYYFDFRYEDELENETSLSLKEIQDQCRDLMKQTNVRDQDYRVKFIRICNFMNDFWSEL